MEDLIQQLLRISMSLHYSDVIISGGWGGKNNKEKHLKGNVKSLVWGRGSERLGMDPRSRDDKFIT